ncbi:ER-derived vesicles protein ERV14, putative [Perkinsus marinus ATCC 50983]|uniref:ER-derived vesicles protein ERV14, putative n=1 Tax=Perkinsus marinus (strain ATCC 50983 / TXsc) TaxID=423536 RepID=C5LYC1_PERM5|nr:ER-derived vesicles protein ERV14, putative [Perkinsus marinus ATCC 50983]EEQ98159.1 ER-derived vesicles protein ERV14, putative [Perkinsus marinus ATCC 50983]|eukprot:XP_002765442.1 ER-derived vesicles protein ERV14, putative [Perkinsus marinus ATCC 50983]
MIFYAFLYSWAYVALFITTCALVCITVYMLGEFGDLESDYTNPVDFCNTANQAARYEFALIVATAILLLCAFDWIGLLVFVPFTAVMLREYYTRRYLFDSTLLFKGKKLEHHKNWSAFRLVLYVVLFVYLVFRLVQSIVAYGIDSKYTLFGPHH